MHVYVHTIGDSWDILPSLLCFRHKSRKNVRSRLIDCVLPLTRKWFLQKTGFCSLYLGLKASPSADHRVVFTMLTSPHKSGPAASARHSTLLSYPLAWMTAWRVFALDQSVSTIDVHEGPRLCGPGFLLLPLLERGCEAASLKQEGPRVVGRPTGWDVQAGEDRDPARTAGRLAETQHSQGKERSLRLGGVGEWVLGERMLEAGDWEPRSQIRRGRCPARARAVASSWVPHSEAAAECPAM